MPGETEGKGKGLDDQLKEQADELGQPAPLLALQKAKSRSRVVDILSLLVLLLVTGAAVFLLVSDDTRLRLLRGVGNTWNSLYPESERAEVFRLPPPPPKAVEPRVVLQGSPTVTFRSGGGAREATPAPSDESQGEVAAGTEAAAPPGPPEKTVGSEAAYSLLVRKSEIARKLTTNAIAGLTFKRWAPVRNQPPEFWVDLVASRAGGQDAHFIWSVNTEEESVRALSQDARDLERAQPQ